jgi:hypothetical protein
MRIKMNLKSNFKLVPEGERELTITKAECKPSGKPNSLVVTFQDSEGGFINNRYNFDNDKSLFAMGKMLETALGFEDGDEFDTKIDVERLIGKKLLCEVVHTQGTKPNDNGELPTFANIRRTISLITDETSTSSDSPRNIIADDDDLD